MDRIVVDADQISQVAAFYRRASLVVYAVSQDLSSHVFGTWARGQPEGDDVMSSLAARYATMGAQLATRLSAQSQAAAVLASTLGRGSSELAAGDAAAAAMIPVIGDTRFGDIR